MNQHFSLQRGERAAAMPVMPELPTGALPLQHRERPAGSRLFDLGQLDVRWEAETGSLWTFMTPIDRPNFNRPMLRDFQRWQEEIRREFAAPGEGLKYLVLGSRFPGIFNLGGDLNLFAGFIATGDRTGLVQYGRDCVSILHNNMRTLGLPIVTIALVQGDALGGGFEAALSSQVIVAERGTRFGLPEVLFNLIPGMGAYSFLSRRIGAGAAEKMILGGAIHTAEELHDLGIVDVLADRGRGEEAVREFLREFDRKSVARRALLRAREAVSPVTREELQRVVDLWVEAALSLSETDLRRMSHLVAAQDRRRGVRQAVAS